jgi:hypothetical protein
MTRRAILAGLLTVLLLAVVVVVLATSGGGGGTEAVALRGQPFTGEGGVTRSVAAIKERQRYLDQHPEIERRRNQELAGRMLVGNSRRRLLGRRLI